MKNTVHLIGRLGKDATSHEWRGKQVSNFMVATTSTYRDKLTGEKKEDVQWHKCVLWQHENLYPFLKAGTVISVQGSIRYDFYEKEVQGEKLNMLTTEILVDEVVLLPSPKKEAQ
ncbi:MAG TPA: single-stranded DNA-binding protein [Chryseosolibacter sp.]